MEKMNTLQIAILPILKNVWSSNNKNLHKFAKNSILMTQLINVPQRLFCDYTQSLTTSMARVDKDLLAREKLEKYLQNPENKNHYQMIQLEIEVLRQNGENIPSIIKDRQILELILLQSRSKRRKYLEFLFGIEKKKENKKAKSKEVENSELLQDQSNVPSYLRYRLGCNSPFLRFRETTVNKLYNWNLMKAIMYGQKVIMDCGFEDKMNRSEIKNCAKQLMLAFAANRVHPNPLDITFCNVNKNGLLHEELFSYIPTMNNTDFPMTISDKTYLELFERHKLIYLTPDSNETLENYDYDGIYIIGGIVDKIAGRPDTLAKAKRDRIRHAKLPIDKYLRFGCGSKKSLTLNQVLLILADLQRTQDWSYAFRHIPRRKLYEYKLKDMENRIKEFCDENKHISFGTIQEKEINEFDIKARKKFRCKK